VDFLLHGLTVQKDVSAIEAAAAERGVDISNTRITEPPSLYAGFDFYITAFWRLHSCRPQAWSGVAWIPWTAIERYASRYDIKGTDFYRFVHYMEMMDSAYRDWAGAKQQQETESSGDDNTGSAQQKVDPPSQALPQGRW